MIRRYDPIYLAKYEFDNDLLGKPGWKHLRCYVKNTKKMNCLIKAAKDKQLRNTVKINFEIKIPHGDKEAMMFDSDNGNTNWKDDELLELYISTTFTPTIISGLSLAYASLPVLQKSKCISYLTIKKWDI